MRRLVHRDAQPAMDVPGAVSRIKAWVRACLALPPDVVLSVSELACSAEGCPPRETVILVMPSGERPKKYSVHKAIPDVAESDIATCVARGYVML